MHIVVMKDISVTCIKGLYSICDLNQRQEEELSLVLGIGHTIIDDFVALWAKNNQ